MLREGSLGAFVILASLIDLLSTQAGHSEDQPKRLNPFAGDPEAVQEGRRLYVANGCSGCHGLMGGGGMGKPISDDTWVFGSDDETLYKLTKGQIPQQTMPKTGTGLTDDQVWKMLAYVRSLYKGDPGLVNWGGAPSRPPPPSRSPAPSPSRAPSPSASPSPSPPPRQGTQELSRSPWGYTRTTD